MKISATSFQDKAQKIDDKTASGAENAMADNQAKTRNNIDKTLHEAVKKLNAEAENNNTQIRFAVYKDTHRILVEVVDKTTNQVVSTFPPKQILDMAASLDKLLTTPATIKV